MLGLGACVGCKSSVLRWVVWRSKLVNREDCSGHLGSEGVSIMGNRRCLLSSLSQSKALPTLLSTTAHRQSVFRHVLLRIST